MDLPISAIKYIQHGHECQVGFSSLCLGTLCIKGIILKEYSAIKLPTILCLQHQYCLKVRKFKS